MRKKYKMTAQSGYPIEFGMDKLPIPGLDKHLGLPKNLTDDVIAFTAKYVESFGNLNRAYFSNVELAKAYHSISFKALDIEHELEKIVGHIHSHAFIDRNSNAIITDEKLAQIALGEYASEPIDVVIGGVTYIDRFPSLESPVSTKAYKISMETYFSYFDLLLENGTVITLEEAEAMGLGEFIEQLMGSFDSQADFDRAHSLWVTTADDKRSQMKIYKYLHDLLFSGGGLVLSPACKSCHILTTSCECEDMKMAASTCVKPESNIKEFEIDLRKSETYMKSIREHGGTTMVHQVTEEIIPTETVPVAEESTEVANVEEASATPPVVETAEQIDTIREAPPTMVPPPSSLPKTPNDITSHSAQCPQYRFQEETSCLFANATCEAAGDRKDKSCRRWFQDDKGVWKFDSRNSISDDEEIVVNENSEDPGTLDEETAKKKHLEWLSKKIESLEYALESFHLERELAQSKLSEKSATWSTQFINGLPNSSFAVVETGYKEGMNKNARHLPFKDGGGKIDLPHLRNALARANQIKNVLGKDSDSDLRARAQRKLAPYAKRYLKTNKED